MNLKAVWALPKTAHSAQIHKSISFIWIVWSTLQCVSAAFWPKKAKGCSEAMADVTNIFFMVFERYMPELKRNIPTSTHDLRTASENHSKTYGTPCRKWKLSTIFDFHEPLSCLECWNKNGFFCYHFNWQLKWICHFCKDIEFFGGQNAFIGSGKE